MQTLTCLDKYQYLNINTTHVHETRSNQNWKEDYDMQIEKEAEEVSTAWFRLQAQNLPI